MKSVDAKTKNQQGLASILVTMIMMIVITLIVLGFAQIARRDQRQSLDAQLGAQAFYAAESGINDALAWHNTHTTGFGEKGSCGNVSGYWSGFSNPTLSTPNTSVTCLTFSNQPSSLQYTDIKAGDTKIANLQTSSGSPINQITISWSDYNGTGGYNGCDSSGTYPATWPTNCGAGVLQVGIVPANNLASDTVLFLYPQPGTALTTNNEPTSPGGSVLPVNCVAPNNLANSTLYPYDCNLRLSMASSNNEYYVRLMPFYEETNVNLDAVDSSGNPITLTNGQLVVDSTGKAQDVLKRVEERFPASASVTFPSAPAGGLQTTNSICKQYTVSNGGPPYTVSGPGASSSC